MILGLALAVLSGTFVLSGIAKLRQPAATAQAMRDFGLAAASPAAARLLGWLELAVGVALPLPTTTVPARLAACVLLVVFTAVILAALAGGRRPVCLCFGQLASRPIDAMTVVRNLVLTVAALVTLAFAYGVVPAWLARADALLVMNGTTTIGGAALLLVGALQWQLVQQQGRMLVRLESLEGRLAQKDQLGLPPGEHAPSFSLPNLDGVVQEFDAFLEQDRSLLLLFSDPLCPSCADIAQRAGEWARSDSSRAAMVVSRGTAEANRAMAEESGLAVLLQTNFEIGETYGAPGTPSAVMIHGDGTIASHLIAGYPAITRLLSGT